MTVVFDMKLNFMDYCYYCYLYVSTSSLKVLCVILGDSGASVRNYDVVFTSNHNLGYSRTRFLMTYDRN